MSWWVWVAVAAGAVLVVVLGFVLVRAGRQEKLAERREKADELRQRAEERFAEAGRREAAARQEERRAGLERAAGEDALQRADEVDPEAPDVQPGSGMHRSPQDPGQASRVAGAKAEERKGT